MYNICYTRKYRKFSRRHNRNELDAYIIYQCRHYIKGDTARNNGPVAHNQTSRRRAHTSSWRRRESFERSPTTPPRATNRHRRRSDTMDLPHRLAPPWQVATHRWCIGRSTTRDRCCRCCRIRSHTILYVYMVYNTLLYAHYRSVRFDKRTRTVNIYCKNRIRVAHKGRPADSTKGYNILYILYIHVYNTRVYTS